MSEQTTKIHTHVRAAMKDKWLSKIRYEHKWVDHNRTPDQFWNALLLDLAQNFEIAKYNKSYSFDKEGNTEFITTNYHFHDTEDRLTVQVFSCYCADFSEGDKPPF